jgi:anti-sigma-K factor RskA
LNHQISELETQVRQLPTGGALGLHNEEPQVQVAKVKPETFARIDDHMSFGEDGARRMDDERERDEELNDEESEPEWRVAVVDVSAFMWAPQAARELVQKGFEVIVPANGQSATIPISCQWS